MCHVPFSMTTTTAPTIQKEEKKVSLHKTVLRFSMLEIYHRYSFTGLKPVRHIKYKWLASNGRHSSIYFLFSFSLNDNKNFDKNRSFYCSHWILLLQIFFSFSFFISLWNFYSIPFAKMKRWFSILIFL